MKQEEKDQVLENLVITDNTKSFIGKMKPNYGNLIKNAKKKKHEDPDFVGYARLANGIVVAIEGNVKTAEGRPPSMPLKIVEIPGKMIGEEDSFTAEIPNYQSDADKFLGS